MNLNEDLAEVIALAHDLGHPPFGHAGEDGLNLAANKYGGFDHNIHTIKLITKLEDIYHEFPGLNFTGDVLDGLIKHNGPVKDKSVVISSVCDFFGINPNYQTSLEGQIATLADDIAYSNHDLDDAIRGGFITIDEALTVPIVQKTFNQVQHDYHNITQPKLIKEVIRRLTIFMIDDLIQHSSKQIILHKVSNLHDVLHMHAPLICFSEEGEIAKNQLKKFLLEYYYKHPQVSRMKLKAIELIKTMFERFLEYPECLPKKWRLMNNSNNSNEAETIIDYIAGMTDRYAIAEYSNLFDPKQFGPIPL